MKRGIKKTGDKICGQGSICPKMNAEDGSWQKRAGQSGGMIGSWKKFCRGSPRYGQDHLIEKPLLPVLEDDGGDTMVGFVVAQRFDGLSEVELAAGGLKKCP